MGSDDHVIVIGGDDVAPSDRSGLRRSPLPMLLVVGVLFVGLIAFVLAPDDAGPTAVEPAGLEAPPEPPRAFVEATAATVPADVPELAVGWKPVSMAGPGWYVSDVAHGPSGWLAVSAGSPVIVHTSDNAVLWEAASLVDTEGSDPQVAVGDGVMAMTAVGFNGTVLGAVSLDGGRTWAETLVDPRPAAVHGVAAIGSKVYAFGEVLEPTDPTWGRGTPVMWRHDDQGWAAIEDPAGGGAVTGVLETSDGSVRAFGLRDGSAASWGVGDALEPVPVEVPPALGWFVEVGSDGGGRYFAVGGRSLTGTGNAVWWSEDLLSWEAPGSGSPLREAIVHDGQVVAVHGDQAGLVFVGLDGESFVSNRYPVVETGWEGFAYIAALATEGETVVMAGLDEADRPAIAVRGTTVQPTSLPVVADFVWSVVAGTESALPDPHNPPVIVTSGDRTFVLASRDGQVWEVGDLDSANPTIEPVLIDGDPIRAAGLGRVGDMVWAFGGDFSRLLILGADGRWTASPMPLSLVDLVFDDGSGLVALGYRGGAPALARRGPDGEWVVEDGAGAAVWPVAAVDGAVFGMLEDASGAVSTVVSTNGVEWEAVGIDGASDWPLVVNGGVPFLRDASDLSAVWLLDRWPEIERVVLPTHSPHTIQRHEDQLWVSGPGALWIRGGDLGWTQTPTGVQHGVMATPGVIPGEAPTLVVSSGESIQLLRLPDGSEGP
jgi:hypothetical protein